MPRHRIKLIINPNADMGNAWRQAADLRPIIDEYGGADWTGTVYPTHATELATEAANQGYELVIAVGGDGTMHEVINGLMRVEPEDRPRLGVVPLGSGNDFAHNIGMEMRPPYALRQVLDGETYQLDIGRVQDDHGRIEYWGNVLGIGFDATVAIRMHSFPIIRRGFLMYLLAALQSVMLDHVAPNLQFISDEESWEGERLMLVICNGAREGGGFYVAPAAKPDDGVFHYATIIDVPRLTLLRILPEVIRGTHERFSQISMGTLRQLELKSDQPLYIHTDGEIYAGFGMDVRNLTVDILPGALIIQK